MCDVSISKNNSQTNISIGNIKNNYLSNNSNLIKVDFSNIINIGSKSLLSNDKTFITIGNINNNFLSNNKNMIKVKLSKLRDIGNIVDNFISNNVKLKKIIINNNKILKILKKKIDKINPKYIIKF